MLSNNGTFEAQFPSRDSVNDAIDLLRAEKAAIESVVPTSSTLEDVFIRTVEGDKS